MGVVSKRREPKEGMADPFLELHKRLGLEEDLDNDDEDDDDG